MFDGPWEKIAALPKKLIIFFKNQGMKLMTSGLNPLFKRPVVFFCSVALAHTPGAKWLDQLVFSCNKQKIQCEWT